MLTINDFVPTYGGVKRNNMKRKSQGGEVEIQDNICEVERRNTWCKETEKLHSCSGKKELHTW